MGFYVFVSGHPCCGHCEGHDEPWHGVGHTFACFTCDREGVKLRGE